MAYICTRKDRCQGCQMLRFDIDKGMACFAKTDFKEIENELKKRREDISFFNEEFFDIFMTDRHEAYENSSKGIYDEAYLNVKRTEFYKKNSGAYCEFLSIVARKFDEMYEVKFLTQKGRYAGCLVICAENEKQARTKHETLAKKKNLIPAEFRKVEGGE